MTVLVRSTRSERPTAKVFNLYEAKTNLSEPVELASRGEEVIIAKSRVPMVRLVPAPQAGMAPEPWLWEGRFTYGAGWDSPLSEAEFKEWESPDEGGLYE